MLAFIPQQDKGIPCEPLGVFNEVVVMVKIKSTLFSIEEILKPQKVCSIVLSIFYNFEDKHLSCHLLIVIHLPGTQNPCELSWAFL
jgi:hypothetical protein